MPIDNNKTAIKAASELKCAVCTDPRSHWPAKLADTHIAFNQGVRDVFLVLTDSDELVFEFLNIADLATRVNVGFPEPSIRSDDVLSVLEMVWTSSAGPMSHLISHMGR